jgi:hypothetical protein
MLLKVVLTHFKHLQVPTIYMMQYDVIHMAQCLKIKYRETDDAFNHRDQTHDN